MTATALPNLAGLFAYEETAHIGAVVCFIACFIRMPEFNDNNPIGANSVIYLRRGQLGWGVTTITARWGCKSL